MTYTERVVNLDGTVIDKPLSEEQINEILKFKKESDELLAKEAAKAQARQALLDKLGITEDEAKLLLGGN